MIVLSHSKPVSGREEIESRLNSYIEHFDRREEIKRREIFRKGDTVIMDKGFYAYRNYLVGINEYRVVPLIFTRHNFDINRLDGMLSYPLSIFDSKDLNGEERKFRALKSRLVNLLQRWEEFKLAKSFELRRLHIYWEICAEVCSFECPFGWNSRCNGF